MEYEFKDRTKVKRHRKPINRTTKRTITFDEKSRRYQHAYVFPVPYTVLNNIILPKHF